MLFFLSSQKSDVIEIDFKKKKKTIPNGMVQQQDVAYLRPYFLLKRSTRPSACVNF